MARAELNEVVIGSITGGYTRLVTGASIQVNIRNAGPATIYAAETGGTTLTNPLTTDALGRVYGWLDEGSYDLTISGPGITTYTHHYEATSGAGTPGPTGATGAPGAGAIGVDVWASQGSPGTVTDWGPIVNSLVSGGAHLLNFSEHVFPFTTPFNLSGQGTSLVLQGTHGRGWYAGSATDHVGTRLIFKGGASPVVSGTDGAMTSGSTTFSSAAAPFTSGASISNVYYAGMTITINGAGPGGTALVTQIINRNSNTSITVADAASTTVSGATYSFSNWTRAINCLGSTAVQIRDMKITYDNPAFDGILIDMRSDVSTWSARGLIRDCVLSGETVNFNLAFTAWPVMAYALVHLSGHGEHFRAEGVQFANARCGVRGMYQNNADDCNFDDCHFVNLYDAYITNPGRFWSFNNCSSQGSGFGGPKTGPIFKTDGPNTIESVFRIRNWSAWDFGGSGDSAAGASMTSGSTTITLTTSYPDLANITDNTFWKDRIVHVRGAGVAGADLHTRVIKRLSGTTLQLRDAAATTVSNVGWGLSDGGFIYQQPTFQWEVRIDGLMTWLSPSPEIEMRGQGSLKLDGWWTNRVIRDDLLGTQAYVQFGDPTTNKMSIDIANFGFGSPNMQAGTNHAISGEIGHDITRMKNVPYALNYEKIDSLHHTTLQSGYSTSGIIPSVVAHSGQTLSNLGAYGNDEVGYIMCSTTGSGATAGDLIDVTFVYPWPTLSTFIPDQSIALFSIILTPIEGADVAGRGVSSAKAAAYAKSAQGVNTGWTLGIGNAVAGAQNLGWSYRIVRT